MACFPRLMTSALNDSCAVAEPLASSRTISALSVFLVMSRLLQPEKEARRPIRRSESCPYTLLNADAKQVRPLLAGSITNPDQGRHVIPLQCPGHCPGNLAIGRDAQASGTSSRVSS